MPELAPSFQTPVRDASNVVYHFGNRFDLINVVDYYYYGVVTLAKRDFSKPHSVFVLDIFAEILL